MAPAASTALLLLMPLLGLDGAPPRCPTACCCPSGDFNSSRLSTSPRLPAPGAPPHSVHCLDSIGNTDTSLRKGTLGGEAAHIGLGGDAQESAKAAMLSGDPPSVFQLDPARRDLRNPFVEDGESEFSTTDTEPSLNKLSPDATSHGTYWDCYLEHGFFEAEVHKKLTSVIQDPAVRKSLVGIIYCVRIIYMEPRELMPVTDYLPKVPQLFKMITAKENIDMISLWQMVYNCPLEYEHHKLQKAGETGSGGLTERNSSERPRALRVIRELQPDEMGRGGG